MSQYLRKTVAKKRLSVEKMTTSPPVTANGSSASPPPPPPPGSSGQSSAAECSASQEPSVFDTHPLSVEVLTELTELLGKIKDPSTTQQVEDGSLSPPPYLSLLSFTLCNIQLYLLLLPRSLSSSSLSSSASFSSSSSFSFSTSFYSS